MGQIKSRCELGAYSKFLRCGGEKNTYGHQLNIVVKQFVGMIGL